MPEFHDRRPRSEMRVRAKDVHAGDNYVHRDGSLSAVTSVSSGKFSPHDGGGIGPKNWTASMRMQPLSGGPEQSKRVQAMTLHTVQRAAPHPLYTNEPPHRYDDAADG